MISKRGKVTYFYRNVNALAPIFLLFNAKNSFKTTVFCIFTLIFYIKPHHLIPNNLRHADLHKSNIIALFIIANEVLYSV